jgi:Carboxypeptidase regulatory-like domain
MRLCFRLLVTIFLFNTLNLNAPAQTSVNGSLRGRITDTKGAAVAAATVTLTNTANNIRQTTTAGEDGSYVFVRIVPGSYSIVAEKTGFKQTRRRSPALVVWTSENGKSAGFPHMAKSGAEWLIAWTDMTGPKRVRTAAIKQLPVN